MYTECVVMQHNRDYGVCTATSEWCHVCKGEGGLGSAAPADLGPPY
jgi:hypothetical protein